jgi:hypothetical protein
MTISYVNNYFPSKIWLPATRKPELVLPALITFPPEKPVTVMTSPHKPKIALYVDNIYYIYIIHTYTHSLSHTNTHTHTHTHTHRCIKYTRTYIHVYIHTYILQDIAVLTNA